MPFLRFSRDKRGYEHTYLVHSVARRGKPTRPRIIYWYRTPPGIRVGRPPFDDEMRRTLEGRNPGVVFDWAALASTPIVTPDPEPWREKRKAERAAKMARRAEEAEEAGDLAEGSPPAAGSESAAGNESTAEPTLEPIVARDDNGAGTQAADGRAAHSEQPGATRPAAQDDAGTRRRRRRGGRRRRPRPGVPTEAATLDTVTVEGEGPKSLDSTSEDAE